MTAEWPKLAAAMLVQLRSNVRKLTQIPLADRDDIGEFAETSSSVTMLTVLCFGWTFFVRPVTAGRLRPNKG